MPHRPAPGVPFGGYPLTDLRDPCFPLTLLNQSPALQHRQAACTLAEAVAHPWSLAHALAAAAMTLATAQGFEE